MKKFILSLFLTFSLLILSNEESKGQCSSCPSGFSTASFPITLQTGCQAVVHYCYLCSPTGHSIAQICGIYIPQTSFCDDIVINNTFWEDLREKTLENLVLTICYDIFGEMPPCSTSFRTSLEIVIPDCMQAIESFYPPNTVILGPCDAEPGLCTKEYEICWDGEKIQSSVKSINFEPGECDNEPFELDIYSLPTFCFSTGCY